MKYLDLKIIIWKENKYYVAQSLGVDISSFGLTKQEALKNIREALELYFEDTALAEIPKIEEPEILSTSLAYA